jgi:hypothetical protein
MSQRRYALSAWLGLLSFIVASSVGRLRGSKMAAE